MSVRGRRFEINLSADEEDSTVTESSRGNGLSLFNFIGDIQERPSGAPTPPQPKSTVSGFPAHKKRAAVSTFKQQRVAGADGTPGGHPAIQRPEPDSFDTAEATPGNGASNEAFERCRIDAENKERISQMSDAEIEKERQELMAGLSPSLIERLLRRANIDGVAATANSTSQAGGTAYAETEAKASKPPKRVTFNVSEDHNTLSPNESSSAALNLDSTSLRPSPNLQPQSQPLSALDQIPNIHFPSAPQPPELDPSSPNFLEELHTKYFPSLPADPSKMAWMAPLPSEDSPADRDSPYHPDLEALPASSIRFSFRGELIPPSTAREIPVTAGLHHHGLAPEAAGYTIPELARLARSAFPAQRCIAYQTLGRLLYRLGKGEFGDEDSELSQGLWHYIKEGKVIATLLEEMNEDGKTEGRRRSHASAKAYATEAVWLWRQGGGRKWKAK